METRTFRNAIGSCLLLAATALATLFLRLGGLPFMGADEPRYARIAEEMNRAGLWVTPLLEGHPWLEKPPLYYWLTIFSYRLFGVDESAARLGSVFCAFLACAAILWLGTRLWSRQAGLLGSMILLTSIGFCAFGRSASPDMPLTACLTMAMVLLAAAVQTGLAGWVLWAAYVFLGLAVLAKGPVALILAAGIILLFWVLDEQGGSLPRMRVIPGAALAALTALPWFLLAFRQNGFSFIAVFFINHHLARYVSDLHHHEQPFYYFLPVLLGLLFPWSGWLPELFPTSWKESLRNWRRWDRGVLFLACWTAFPFLFFSLSTSKLPGYILPALPPLALLLGKRLAERIQDGEEKPGGKASRWTGLIFSLGVAGALPIIFYTSYGEAWRPGVWLAAAVIVPALFAFWCSRRGAIRAAVRTTVLQGLVFVLALTQVAFAPLAAYHSAREIARQAVAAGAGGEPIISYCYFHQTLSYYTDYRVDANLVDPGALLAYARRHPRFLVVAEAPRAQELQNMPELSAVMLGAQGKLRLLRIKIAPGIADPHSN